MPCLARILHFFFVATCLWVYAAPADAAIYWTGDVDPDQPATWTSSTTAYIGKTTSATLDITAWGHVVNGDAYIGDEPNSTGQVTVGGDDAIWENSDDLYVGNQGSGLLAIGDGGEVTVARTTWVAHEPGSSGSIHFDHGTLTTEDLYCSVDDLVGTGTINLRGIVSDVDLVFDATSGLSQTFTVNENPGQEITVHLDVNPYRTMGVGFRGAGSMSVTDAVVVESWNGYLGYDVGSTGHAAVSGVGSAWNTHGIWIGRFGSGTLNITNGGQVSCDPTYTNVTHIGLDCGASGHVTVDGAGSTWTSSELLTIGYGGKGTMKIAAGGAVNSERVCAGYWDDSIGYITIDGAGSTWTNPQVFYVGNYGTGVMAITSGGRLESSSGYIGYHSGSMSRVTVDGAGSTWMSSGSISVQNGMLVIANGGAVTATGFSIAASSLAAIEVSDGSRLSASSGTGSIDNDGTVRIIAGAAPAAGAKYSPIAAGTWEGSGVYQGVGGNWNETTHEFTASAIAQTTSGTPIEFDRATIQRATISDTATGWAVGVSLLEQEASTPIAFTATALDGELLDNLTNHLDPGDSVLGGWRFEIAEGSIDGEPAYLSFDIGPDQSRDDLQVWRHNGTEWLQYDAWDIVCNGTYASFTVTELNTYAVTPGKEIWIPGDANGDNRVDNLDAARLAAHWGQSGDRSDGDFNGDGTVDMADASIMAANWGAGASGERTGGDSSVPEPGLAGLLVGGLMALLVGSSRKWGRGHLVE